LRISILYIHLTNITAAIKLLSVICCLPRPDDLISVLTETLSTGHRPNDPVLVRSHVRVTVRSVDCVCFLTGHEGKLPKEYFRSRWSDRNDSNRCYPPGDYPHTVSVIATVLPLDQTFWRSRYCYQYCESVCAKTEISD